MEPMHACTHLGDTLMTQAWLLVILEISTSKKHLNINLINIHLNVNIPITNDTQHMCPSL